MRAIEISAPGRPEVLKEVDRPIPQISDDQLLVRVFASGVNGPDIMQRKGLYPPPKGASDLPGLEISGEVIEVGAAVTNFKIGEKICALTNGGGYAELAAINADHCLPIPKGVSEIDAAGLCETYFTVWSNVFFQNENFSGKNMLVHGGSGGIGSTAIQLGAQNGLQVFTTCSDERKAAFCKACGAHQVINYKQEDFVSIVASQGGADIVLDIVGGDYVTRNFKAANMDARIIQLAFRTGSKVDIDLMPIMLKRLTLTGSTLRPRSANYKAAIAKDLTEKVWPLLEKGKLKTHTFATFPIQQAADAHTMMEKAEHVGKIILTA